MDDELTEEPEYKRTIRVLEEMIGEKAEVTMHEGFDGRLKDRIPFGCRINFGKQYKIELWHLLQRDDVNGLTMWMARDWGYRVRNNEGKVLMKTRWASSEGYEREEIEEDKVIPEARKNIISKSLGGFDVESPAFMDFERYTLKSLSGENRWIEKNENGEEDGENRDDSYFKSVYLAIMCDLKEKGLEMPPILSKRESIRELMFEGKVEEVESELELALSEVESIGKGCLFHAQEEAKEIRKLAVEKQKYYDKNIPLIEKLTSVDVKTVPGNNCRKRNILVVEDFGDIPTDHQGTIGRLSRKLTEELAKRGNYCGTNIFSTMNLGQCLNICGSGQIDLILMDGGNNNMANVTSSVP